MLEICKERFDQTKASTKTDVLSELAEKAKHEKGECIPGNWGYISKPIGDKYHAKQSEFQVQAVNINDLSSCSEGLLNLINDPGTDQTEVNKLFKRIIEETRNEEVFEFAIGCLSAELSNLSRSYNGHDGALEVYAFLTRTLENWLTYGSEHFHEKRVISVLELLSNTTTTWAVECCALACNHNTPYTSPALMHSALRTLEQIENNRACARLALAEQSKGYIRDDRTRFEGDGWKYVPKEFCESLSEFSGLGKIDFRNEGHAYDKEKCLKRYAEIHNQNEILSTDVVEAIRLCLLWANDWVDYDGDQSPKGEDSRPYSESILECKAFALDLLSYIPADALGGFPDLSSTLSEGPDDFEDKRLGVLSKAKSLDSLEIDRLISLARYCFAANPLDDSVKTSVLRVLKNPATLEAKDSRVVTLLLLAAEAEDRKVVHEAKKVLFDNIYDPSLKVPENYLEHVFPYINGASPALRSCFVAELIESSITNGSLSIAFALLCSEHKDWVIEGALDYLLSYWNQEVKFSLLAHLAMSTSNDWLRSRITAQLEPPAAVVSEGYSQVYHELLEHKNITGALADRVLLKALEYFDIPLSKDSVTGLVSFAGDARDIPDNVAFLAKLLPLGLQKREGNRLKDSLSEKALEKLGSFLSLIENIDEFRLGLKARLGNFEERAKQLYELALNGKSAEECLVALGLLVSLSHRADPLARRAVARLCESSNEKIKAEATRLALRYFVSDQSENI